LKLAAEKVAELFLVNRTASKAEEMAGEIKKQFPSVNVSRWVTPKVGGGFAFERHVARLEAGTTPRRWMKNNFR
jgi:shikimate 5-dehydrogenase